MCSTFLVLVRTLTETRRTNCTYLREDFILIETDEDAFSVSSLRRRERCFFLFILDPKKKKICLEALKENSG